MASLYLRNGIYYIQYYYKGKRVQRSLETRNSVEATHKLKEQEAKLVLKLEEERPDKVTLEKFIELYTSWSKNYKSLGTYKYDSYRLVDYRKAFTNRYLKNITPLQIERHINDRRQKCATSTINREIGFIKAFFNKAVEWEILSKNPAAKIKLFKKENRKIPKFFSEKEVALLLCKAQNNSTYLHLIILTAVHTGLRKSELIHLTWHDINFDNNSLFVQAKKGWHPKNYQIRTIPIEPPLPVELKKHNLSQKDLTKWVFPTIFGTLRKNNLGRDFVTLLKKCGLYKCGVGWHTLRHTFASHLVMKGTPLSTIANLLGHESTKTTEIYSHLSPDHLRESIQKLPFNQTLKSRNGDSFGDSNNKGVKPNDLTP